MRAIFYFFMVALLLIVSFPIIWMILGSFKTNLQITDPNKIFPL